MTDKYNGWTNRETWMVNLWLNNEEATYHAARAICAGEYPRQELEQYVEELIGWSDEANRFAADLVHAALSRVDWNEIVRNFAEA